jgi:protein-S-isoprenylcysteine O-methyltransferase Ste14
MAEVPRAVAGQSTDVRADDAPAPRVAGARNHANVDRILEWSECLGILALYGWLVVRLLNGYSAGGIFANLFLLPSEGLVIFFMLIRRRSRKLARTPLAWLLAIGATCMPLLVSPTFSAWSIPPAVGGVVMLCGILLQVHAKLVLGRSFGCVAANRGVKEGGPYRFVRHPMYGGYLISHMAFLAMNPSVGNAIVYAMTYALQIPRILMEEQLLAEDPQYRRYQSLVRYRLIPGLF